MYESDVDKTKAAIQSILGKGPKRLMVILGAIIFLIFFIRPWVQVGAGQRGIVLNFGAVQKIVLEEGLHLRIPLMQEGRNGCGSSFGRSSGCQFPCSLELSYRSGQG
jgi:hypothetical protein